MRPIEEIVISVKAKLQHRSSLYAGEEFAEIERIIAELERLQHDNKVLALKSRIIDRLPLCPDHRDKVLGDPCKQCELERLQTIVAKLPVTADGVPVVVGHTELWWVPHGHDHAENLGRVYLMTVGVFVGPVNEADVVCERRVQIPLCWCYSTRAAAEAAKEK